MLFGHQDKVELFKGLAKSDSLGHAYLFYGDPQIGKSLFAKYLAYFLEYGEFEETRKPLLDTTFVLPDEEKETISIDTTRALRSFLFQKPLKSSRRLIVIDEAERLTSQAQASLLKFVEESPPAVVFIFITHDSQALIPPLASRLMKIYFRRFSRRDIETILNKDFEVAKEQAHKIADKSFGRLGRALELWRKKELDNDSLGNFINEKIITLYLKDKFRHSGVLSWLLTKESEIHRFNLNPKLQKKAINSRLLNS